MAKILSHVWSSASGSIAGITYFNGPHGAIIARARVVPVDPSTLYQNVARSVWQGAAAAWTAETEAVQTDWDAYAQTVIHSGKQGDYTVTGRSMYMAGWALANYIQTRGLAAPTIVTSGPLTTGWLLPSNFILTAPQAAGTGFGLQMTSDLEDDTLVFLEISQGFTKDRHFWKGPWQGHLAYAAIQPAGTSTTHDILNLRLGDFYFVRVKCVADDASCRVSKEWFGRIEASTTVIAAASNASIPKVIPAKKKSSKS